MSRFGPEVVLDRPAFIHPTALLYGRIRIGEGASVWPYAVLRAEAASVEVGPYSNIQDHAVLHIGGGAATRIGAWCSITHRACIHGATIEDSCLIGIGATVMERAVVGEGSIVAGHCIITEGTNEPPRSIVAGVPGKVVASRDNFLRTRRNALLYSWNALAYAEGRHRAWDEPAFEAFCDVEMPKLEAEAAARSGAAES
jgi:carbonic anhydrase/acetyltransferase-like protein (isoleucine patch superfamily)